MKNSHNLRDLQQAKKTKDEERWIHQPKCMVCGKECEGYYARFGDTGTCSGDCMRVQDAKPRYPGFPEEEFLQRQGKES